VRTAFDRLQARQTFEQALEEIRRIPGRDGAYLLDHARLFAAAIAPDLLLGIPHEHQFPRHFEAESLGRTMIEHGHSEAALEFVMHGDDASTSAASSSGNKLRLDVPLRNSTVSLTAESESACQKLIKHQSPEWSIPFTEPAIPSAVAS
jgi:hypothetical protein